MDDEQYIDIPDGLSVGTTKIANKYEIFTEKEVDAINNKIPELDERVGIIEDEIEEINSSLDNIIQKNHYGLFSDIKNKYRGSSIYLPYREDLDGTFEENVNKSFQTNCNTISICPIFWMNDKTGNIVGYKSGLNIDKIKQSCSYVKSLGMKVLLKPHVGGDGIGSHGDIIPSDINAWTDSYINQLVNLFDYCKEYVDILSISNEINGQSEFNYTKWKNGIDSIRALKPSILLTNANTVTELQSNVFLADLDILGCNIYVGVQGDLSTNKEIQRASLFTTSNSINNLFEKANELGKKILITEVGILPYERSLQSPESWGFTDNPPINYNAQVRYYELAIKEYIYASNVIGVMVWNACDGYTFIDRPAQETLKKIYGGEIIV